jgi:hypothetical protein
MKYALVFISFMASLTIVANAFFELGDKQGYARGYFEGKQVEPDTAQCIGYWFGGKVPANRMNELRNFCKEMK